MIVFLEEKKTYHKLYFSPNPCLICHQGIYSRKEEFFGLYNLGRHWSLFWNFPPCNFHAEINPRNCTMTHSSQLDFLFLLVFLFNLLLWHNEITVLWDRLHYPGKKDKRITLQKILNKRNKYGQAGFEINNTFYNILSMDSKWNSFIWM